MDENAALYKAGQMTGMLAEDVIKQILVESGLFTLVDDILVEVPDSVVEGTVTPIDETVRALPAPQVVGDKS